MDGNTYVDTMMSFDAVMTFYSVFVLEKNIHSLSEGIKFSNYININIYRNIKMSYFFLSFFKGNLL